MKDYIRMPSSVPSASATDQRPATEASGGPEASGLRQYTPVSPPESRSTHAARLMMVAAARSAEALHSRLALPMSGGE